MEPKVLDARLVLNQLLYCMRFETYEQAGLKIRNIPFEQDAFPRSFLVRGKMDKLLNFAFRISKSALQRIHSYLFKCARLKCSWNLPSTRNLSGLKWSGSGKSIGLNMTDSNEALNRVIIKRNYSASGFRHLNNKKTLSLTSVPCLIKYPPTSVSWMHLCKSESPTGLNLKFSSRTALK